VLLVGRQGALEEDGVGGLRGRRRQSHDADPDSVTWHALIALPQGREATVSVMYRSPSEWFTVVVDDPQPGPIYNWE
jgi:hypothetical protein